MLMCVASLSRDGCVTSKSVLHLLAYTLPILFCWLFVVDMFCCCSSVSLCHTYYYYCRCCFCVFVSLWSSLVILLYTHTHTHIILVHDSCCTTRRVSHITLSRGQTKQQQHNERGIYNRGKEHDNLKAYRYIPRVYRKVKPDYIRVRFDLRYR